MKLILDQFRIFNKFFLKTVFFNKILFQKQFRYFKKVAEIS